MRRPTLAALVLLMVIAARPAAAQLNDDAPAWLTFEEALVAAEESNKKVMVFIYAPWCGYCQKMMKEVYPRDDVQREMAEHYEFARLNGAITTDTVRYKQHELSSQELAVGLGMRGYPTHVFLSSTGEYVAHQPGYLDAEPFMQLLGYMGGDAYKTLSFQEFGEGR